MHTLSQGLRKKGIILVSCLLMLVLSACGASNTSSNGGSQSGAALAQSCNGTKGNITTASKLDVESQLLTKMYTLLLCKAGYHVTEKAALGNSTIIFKAITSNNIDLYPEFTATGLNTLGIASTYDPQKDYQAVKDGFNSKYSITWLDASPLNDGYALCMTKDESQKTGITSLSDLSSKVSQFTLVSPSDGIDFVNGLKRTYNFDTTSFKQTSKVDYNIGFQALSKGQAQVAVCYGTDATVPQQNFVFLKDDKNGFPAFNPAPIVRNAVLAKYKDIPSILNPLAPKLTTDVSIQLQQEVASKHSSGASSEQAVKLTALDFLQKQGLL